MSGVKSIACGVKVSGTVSCWSWNHEWNEDGEREYELIERDSPDGPFTDISTSASVWNSTTYSIVCGIKVDETVSCWSWDYYYNQDMCTFVYDALVEVEAPDGTFAAFSAPDNGAICWLGADGTVGCWDWECDHSANRLACSHSVRGSESSDGAEKATPPGQFSTLRNVRFVSCGLRVDGAVQCWSYRLGDDGNGNPVPHGNEILETFNLGDPTG